MKRLCMALILSASMGQAQETIIVETLEDPESFEFAPVEPTLEITQTEQATLRAEGAILRGLDKLNGDVVDVELGVGYSFTIGTLRVDLADCRYPDENATGEGYAFLSVYENGNLNQPFFRGWMIASSPALNAMDHPRYDVWLVRCRTSEGASDSSEENTASD